MLTTETITAEYAGKLAEREKYADKSTYGKLLIIAGSKGMAGAAYLAGLAAFRSGIGMVRFLGPEENRGILQTLLPEAMYNVENFSYVPDSGTAEGSQPTGHDHLQYRSAAGTAEGSPASDPAGTEAFRKAFDWATHIIIGPGLSTDETAAKRVRELFAADLSSKQLVIIDADALNLIASGTVSLPPSGANIIITPHPGEMARLSGLPVREILDRPLDTAHAFSEKYDVTAVLKNAETYIASPDGRIAANALGMEVLGYDPYIPHLRALELKGDVKFVETLDEIFEECDFISLHVPLNDETRQIIGRKEIEKMKDGVFICNYARGPVIDNEAVCDALDSGKIAGFATDFPTEEQLKRPDVVSTPHLGAGTPEAEENCAIMAARQTREYLENGNITNSVNFPDVSFARAEGDRITVFHKNQVGMLGRITERAASRGLNIENLVNKARGDVAYTILDFNDAVPEGLEEALGEIDGVIRVRVICS